MGGGKMAARIVLSIKLGPLGLRWSPGGLRCPSPLASNPLRLLPAHPAGAGLCRCGHRLRVHFDADLGLGSIFPARLLSEKPEIKRR